MRIYLLSSYIVVLVCTTTTSEAAQPSTCSSSRSQSVLPSPPSRPFHLFVSYIQGCESSDSDPPVQLDTYALAMLGNGDLLVFPPIPVPSGCLASALGTFWLPFRPFRPFRLRIDGLSVQSSMLIHRGNEAVVGLLKDPAWRCTSG